MKKCIMPILYSSVITFALERKRKLDATNAYHNNT